MNINGRKLTGVYGRGRLTVYSDRGLLTADWTGLMATEAQEIWIEQDGAREIVKPESTKTTMASAFVASVLDGAPNIAQVVALTEAAYRSAEQGCIVQIEQ